MTTLLNIDALLDSTLDNTPDVPDYTNPPMGLYILGIPKAELETYTNKAKEENLRVKITYAVENTIETEGMPVANGTLFTETFQATEDGLKYFKKQARKLLNVSDLNGVPMRDILASLTGVTGIKAKITIRVSKGDSGQEYENINVRPMFEDTTHE
jgi:hypothetical protein